jgi:hypothetical protein
MSKSKINAVFKKVHHPGTKAQPFLRPALAVGAEVLKKEVAKGMGECKRLDEPTIRAKLAKAVKVAAMVVWTKARQLVPVRTGGGGGLKGTLNAQRRNDLLWTVGTNKSYARWVEEGTKPHDIRPKTKRALAFFWEKLAQQRKAHGRALREDRRRSKAT